MSVSRPEGPLPLLLALPLVAAACGDGGTADEPEAHTGSVTGPALGPPTVDDEDRQEARRLFVQAKRAIRAGDPSLADERLTAAVALDPSYAEAWLLLGQVLVGLSDVVVGTPTRDNAQVARAVDAYEHLVALRPEDAEAYYRLGQALVLGEDTTLAIEPFRRAVELDPSLGVAWRELGILLSDLGRSDEAREALGRAVKEVPDAEAFFRYGNELELVDDLEGARDAYLRSLELDWAIPATYTKLATVLQATGDTGGARLAVEAYQAWGAWGKELRAAGDAAKYDRSNRDLGLAAATVYLRGRRTADGTFWLERVLRDHPGDAETEALLARVRAGEFGPDPEARFQLPMNSLEDAP